MATLHMINKASMDHSANIDCLRSLADGDGLIFIEDATYLTDQKHITHKSVSFFASQHDLHTRGLSPSSSIQITNSADFVELCTRYEKVVSWF